MRWITMMSALLGLPLMVCAQDPQPAEPDKPATIVRTYNVSDLMRQTVDYPLDSNIEPPTGFGAGRLSGYGGGAMFIDPAPRKRDVEALDPLSKLIVEVIAPDTWHESGGSIGQIKTFNALLVITQTQANHDKVEALLAEIRKNANPAQIVAIRATWVLLGSGEAPQPASIVTSDWMAKQRIYCDARTVCFSGQVVHVASGRGRTVVTDMVPIVGTSAAAFDPQASLMQSGVSLQVAPQLVPGAESAIVDVHSYASELAEPGAIGVSAAVATQPAGGAQASSAVDRVNALAQQMKTTLRVPLGKLVVVGGMTLDPASADQHDRQLCLLLEVTAVK